MRNIILYPGEDGYWIAECPSLPPCISQGKTKEEAINNIKEAIELYVEMLREENRIIPEDKVETLLLEV
jgi:predicted RNase H-like HicB family nuclease